MQTKKRAKPVKFGKSAKETETKEEKVAAPEVEPEAAESTAAPVAASAPVPPAAPAPQNEELVDKLSDVPFETNFGTPSTEAASPAIPSAPASQVPPPEPGAFSASPVEPAAPEPLSPPQPLSPAVPEADANPISPSQTIPPIGRSNEPIPFNPHETVFNTPPDGGEKKKNPFLYFLIIAFVAFVTGIAFMAGIYYAMPDKNFFATPSLPSLPSLPSIPGLPAGQPTATATPAPVAQATATPAAEVKLADYKVRVLNGSGVSGQAAKVKASLEAAGFTVTSIGNADRNDVAKTQITYKKAVTKVALTKLTDALKKTYALDKETELPTSAAQEADITVTIGRETAK